MKVFCIGRNYVDHAKELNNAVPTKPVVFMKPPTALVKNNRPFYYPDFSKEVHHEVELVLRINRNGKNIQERFAHKYTNEVALGIDFTARDLQSELKAKGHPWEISKGFDGSAVIGTFVPLEDINQEISFHLENQDGVLQKGNSKDMIFSFAAIISYLSSFYLLQKGDLIYTGTPAGVSSVKIGDKLDGYIEEQKIFQCRIK